MPPKEYTRLMKELAAKVKALLGRLDKADGEEDGMIFRSAALPLAEKELAEKRKEIALHPEGTNAVYLDLLEGCVKQLKSGKGAYGIMSKDKDLMWTRPQDTLVEDAFDKKPTPLPTQRHASKPVFLSIKN